MLKRAALLLICSGILSSSFGQSNKPTQKKEKTKAVFSVAGKPVTTDEFIYLYKKNHPGNQSDFTHQKIEEYLDLFINFKLKVQEARKRGMDTTASFVKEFNSYKEELRKPYLPDVKLTDSLVLLTYDRMKEEVKASHILIGLKADASPDDTLKAYTRLMEIRNKVVAGEDFGAAAATFSEDPSAKSNRGSLGYFTAMQMVYPFESAAYATKTGEISMPVRTRFGYHLIKVIDRRPARGEVEVSHIMLRTGGQKNNDEVRNSIFSIYEQLQAGMKWDELCKQFSEDPASKDNGGRLRPFGAGAMASVPEFENTAFQLKPGDVSDPVQTQYGWHIIRLEKKIPLSSFETLSPTLKNRVNRDERTTLSKQAMQVKLRKEYQLDENQPLKEKVFSLADSSLLKGKWKAASFPNAAKERLFSLKGKPYTAQDFLSYAQKIQQSSVLAPRKYIEQLYTNFVDASILQLVEEKIVRDNPTYSFLLQEYYEGILLFEIMEKEVWNKASEDSVGQLTYYKGHLSAYQAEERTKASLYSASTPDFQAPLKEIVSSGSEAKVFEYVNLKKLKTESGYFKRDENPVFQKMPWAPGVYPAENNGMYYLAWLRDILPPGPMSFEEARPAVISDYQAFLEKKWLEQLKKKYSVRVNEKGKQYILQQLEAK